VLESKYPYIYGKWGYRSLSELAADDPEKMYQDLTKLSGSHVDRCMLYVFRCIHYVLNTDKPDPELKKWWNWKD
jgi:hypothetical protein